MPGVFLALVSKYFVFLLEEISSDSVVFFADVGVTKTVAEGTHLSLFPNGGSCYLACVM